MRLDKAVSMAGLSRAEAKKVIKSGDVTLNGKVITDCAAKTEYTDCVTLSGTVISLKPHRHIMLNKPAGCITATFDPRGEMTVMDMLPVNMRFKDLGPVGRLDKDVTGLVILTTDGTLAHRLISPSCDIEKRYLAKVEGRLTEEAVRAFENGIELKDFTAKPARLEIISASDDESNCLVYVREGKFHQVKRMLAAVGNPVIELNRQAIAGLELDIGLKSGEFRYLTQEEEDGLYEKAGMKTHE